MKALRQISSRVLLVLAMVAVLVPVSAAPAFAVPLAGSAIGDMSNHAPYQYTYVTAYATVRDTAGRPIKGALVTFTWKFKTVTRYMTAYTNAYGKAAATRYISGATRGYKVVVYVRASSGGRTAYGSTYFIPR